MSITESKLLRRNDQVILQEELETRYGRNIATDIISNVERAMASKATPDYMPVKACSEILELFRGEAKDLAARLKRQYPNRLDEEPKIVDLEKRRLEIEFRYTYRLYQISMGLFYPLYQRAITGCYDKISAPFGEYGENTPTSLAA